MTLTVDGRQSMHRKLAFSPSFSANTYKLFELPPEVSDGLTCGQRICIKGTGTSDAVLCTESSTYSITKVENSNTRLLASVDMTAQSFSDDCTGHDERCESHENGEKRENRAQNGEKSDNIAAQSPMAADKENENDCNVGGRANSGVEQFNSGSPTIGKKRKMERGAKCIQIVGAIKHEYQVKKLETLCLHQLLPLLHPSRYKGNESPTEEPSKDLSGDGHAKKYLDWQSIRSNILASDKEIKQALEELNAVHVNGHWRIVDDELKAEAAGIVISLIIENDWDLESVSLEQCHQECEFLDKIVLRAAVGSMAKAGQWENQKQDIFSLDKGKVARTCAINLLMERERNKKSEKWTVEDFQDKFTLALPKGVSDDLEVLKGLALRESSGPSTVLRYFPVEDLPLSPKARFNALFGLKSTWALEELRPYLAPIVSASQSEASLLLKFTRSFLQSGMSGQRLYSQR